MNRPLADALRLLEEKTFRLSADEAIEAVDAQIAATQEQEFRPHFEVHKAGVLWAAGRQQEAIEVLERCATVYPDVDSAHYMAGEYLVELGRLEDALRHLNACLGIIENSGDNWLRDSAVLLRAFAAAKLGRLDIARSDLALIDDDEEISWVQADLPISKPSIQRIIDDATLRRKS